MEKKFSVELTRQEAVEELMALEDDLFAVAEKNMITPSQYHRIDMLLNRTLRMLELKITFRDDFEE